MGQPKPRKGKPPTSGSGSSKAGKLPKFKKQKRQPVAAAAAGEGGAEGTPPPPPPPPPRKKRPRSFWGLVGVVAAAASLWIWAVKEKRGRDSRILARLRRKPLVYTEHAACRMGCRFVGKAEVLETLAKGRVNDRKSQPGERPCPKYVVDAAVGPRRKNVQCVFTDCPDATNVITVIDTDTNWACPPC